MEEGVGDYLAHATQNKAPVSPPPGRRRKEGRRMESSYLFLIQSIEKVKRPVAVRETDHLPHVLLHIYLPKKIQRREKS